MLVPLAPVRGSVMCGAVVFLSAIVVGWARSSVVCTSTVVDRGNVVASAGAGVAAVVTITGAVVLATGVDTIFTVLTW